MNHSPTGLLADSNPANNSVKIPFIPYLGQPTSSVLGILGLGHVHELEDPTGLSMIRVVDDHITY